MVGHPSLVEMREGKTSEADLGPTEDPADKNSLQLLLVEQPHWELGDRGTRPSLHWGLGAGSLDLARALGERTLGVLTETLNGKQRILGWTEAGKDRRQVPSTLQQRLEPRIAGPRIGCKSLAQLCWATPVPLAL